MPGHIGKPIVRNEDLRLLTGRGEFSDDRNLPEQAHAAMVRSPHAHARILEIDPSAAMAIDGVLLVVTGCSKSIHESKDYYRHSLSQLSVPRDGGDFVWFDVKLSPEYPDSNPAAEEQRMEWLEDWLEVRQMCANGYEILERREFGFLEHNPAQYDLRYKVQCKVA